MIHLSDFVTTSSCTNVDGVTTSVFGNEMAMIDLGKFWIFLQSPLHRNARCCTHICRCCRGDWGWEDVLPAMRISFQVERRAIGLASLCGVGTGERCGRMGRSGLHFSYLHGTPPKRRTCIVRTSCCAAMAPVRDEAIVETHPLNAPDPPDPSLAYAASRLPSLTSFCTVVSLRRRSCGKGMPRRTRAFIVP
jgi:hypothetical protein